MRRRAKKSPSDSSDTSIDAQWKNPMASNHASDSIEAEQVLATATSALEKPMDIEQDEQKKALAYLIMFPFKSRPGSPETGTPEQKQ